MRNVLADGVSPTDAPLMMLVAAAIVLASVAAALIPARRALSISPAVAMRDAG
jgi:ABC-type lipoprotein release transport system permease subunit